MDSLLWWQKFKASIESLLGPGDPDFNQSNISDVRFIPQEQLLFGVNVSCAPLCGALFN